MCGIVGWARSTESGDEIPLERMRDQLLHRGPDDRGLWISKSHRVGMGHCRLSIIDLSENAHQPMVLDGGRLSIIFNGEIYNFEEIRRELQRDGCRFSSRSDTEVILRAYQKWGTSCVSRFDGMFAFAIFDASRDALFLARDRVGEKPLYYAHEGGQLIWASEMKALLAAPNVKRRVSYGALSDYLEYGFIGGEECILEGIRKLPPAHSLSFSLLNGESTLLRYWRPPTSAAGMSERFSAQRNPLGEDLIGELRRLLTSSVERRLIADVPIGVLLSSGIDSGLVAAAAAKLRSGPIDTFTVVNPDDPSSDEGPGARALAQAIGARHTELHIEGIDDALLEALARQYDEPIADHSIVPTYLICRALRAHVKVALGGDGGDELFGGYPHYRLVALQAALRRFLPEAVRKATSLFAEQAIPIGYRGRNHLMGLSGGLGNAIAHVNVYFDRHSQERLLGGPALAPSWIESVRRGDPEFSGDQMPPTLRAMRADFLTVLPDSYLVKSDRASMLASIELRSPFLEPGIIDFAFTKVPQRLRISRTEQKVILRRLGEDLVPGWSPERKKRGFVMPLARWIRGSLGRRFEEILTDPSQTLFNRQYVERLFALQRQGANNANRIFCLVMFELWRRHYKPEFPAR